MRPSESGRFRLGAFGFFGMGNLGNEASLAALLEHVRGLDPDIDVRCFVGDPQVAGQEHQVAATALMSHRSRPGARGPVESLRKAWGRVVDVPRIWGLVGQVDVVVVPGMGVLEPTLGGANLWGFPYWQFLVALSARLRRRPFVLLSVGAGVPTNPWIRFYFRSTLRLARYTTFRDEGSLTAANELRGQPRPGTVSADLAFGLSAPPGLGPPIAGRVVVGVMTPDTSGPSADTVAVYIDKLSLAVGRLIDRGHTVRLVVGDLADLAIAHRVADRVRERLPRLDRSMLGVSDARTLRALMLEMSQAEVVVASRYHNLVCALMVSRPAVSLGYADKNAELVASFGLAGYDQSMVAFDLDVLDRHIKELRERRVELEPEMARTLARLDIALRDQYLELEDRILYARTRK